MSITLPAEPRARLPSPPTEGQHRGHGLGSQRSRLGSASRSASAGRKNPRWKQLRASSLLGERQRSGAEGERQLLPDNSSTSWEPGGAGRGRQEPEGSGEHRAPSRPRSGEPGAGQGRGGRGRGGAPVRNRRERGGRVLTYAVLLLPFGGHPAGHGAGEPPRCQSPAPYAAIFPPRDGKSFSRPRSHVVRAEPARPAAPQRPLRARPPAPWMRTTGRAPHKGSAVPVPLLFQVPPRLSPFVSQVLPAVSPGPPRLSPVVSQVHPAVLCREVSGRVLPGDAALKQSGFFASV